MGKKYADFMDEISADDLYKGLLAFGLFSNKIPPVFSSTSFFDYWVVSNALCKFFFTFLEEINHITISRSSGRMRSPN